MRTLSHFRTLVYYDEPQLFVAHDQLDISYVCLLVDKPDDSEKYICTPVSKGRLSDFISGRVDLLSVIKSPETGEMFIGTALNGDLDSISIVQVTENDVRPEWLPEPNFFIEPEPVTDKLVIEESRERQRAIIHFSLNPPEARQQPKIVAERLGQAVRLMQRVITHAYRNALRDVDEATREAISQPGVYQLEVFAFSPGSFTLHMQTTTPADMLGYSHIAKALRIIDLVTEHIDNPAAAVQFIAGYGGHFATAYRDLLQFIMENETPLSYEWSMPERPDTTTRRISDKQAKPVYQALIERTDIGIEEKRLVGILNKADEKYGSWRLLVEAEKKEYAGRSNPAQIDLKGLVIGACYEFLCEERLVEERGTGRESTELHLKSYHPV
jgi:hypothetical protein